VHLAIFFDSITKVINWPGNGSKHI